LNEPLRAALSSGSSRGGTRSASGASVATTASIAARWRAADTGADRSRPSPFTA
jgi:hypothetical protein